MKRFLLFSILPLTVTFANYPSVEENSKAKILAVSSNDKINIDGKLTEKIWQRPGFQQTYSTGS